MPRGTVGSIPTSATKCLRCSVRLLLVEQTESAHDHLPGSGYPHGEADAAELGYFAFQARGRWFESNRSGQSERSSVDRALNVLSPILARSHHEDIRHRQGDAAGIGYFW